MFPLLLFYFGTLSYITFNHFVAFDDGLYRTTKYLVSSRRGNLSYKDGLYFTLNANIKWFRHQSPLLWELKRISFDSTSSKHVKREQNQTILWCLV